MIKLPAYSVKNVSIASAAVVATMHIGLSVLASRPQFKTEEGKKRIAKGRKAANVYAVLMAAEVAVIAYVG